jgi:MOSC domain-containing protein YiiM
MAIEKEILLNTMPQTGTVTWIGLRPEKSGELQPVAEAGITLEAGLTGDHYHGKSGKRQVTLIQAEHLDAVAKILGKESIDPGLTRRNIVVSGVNLLAFNDRRLTIGEVILEVTGLCHPCSRMEENLGPGGYNAMRGHGGLTTRVVKGGTIRVGDAVALAPMPESVAEK